jgi:hypothetical protein
MRYRNLDYNIKTGLDGKVIWVVHTPKPTQGTVRSRTVAITVVKLEIDAWCKKNPDACTAAD